MVGKMLSFLSFKCIAVTLLAVVFCSDAYTNYKDSCSKGQRKCTDLNFNSCKKERCTNEAEERVIVCYFTYWAWYRNGIGKYSPENIIPSYCTHIIYAFALLDKETFTVKSADPWADIDNKLYEKVTNLTGKNVKTLLAIGGWTNSDLKVGWSRMFGNATNRAIFIASAVRFMKLHKFSGLDIDYEYPQCPQGHQSAGLPNDAKNFNILMRELKRAMGKKYQLIVTVGGGEEKIKKCYNMAELCQIPDLINIMTYDYHSWLGGVVGSNAPICGTPNNWGVYESVDYMTRCAKCPAKKMVLGVPFYGKSYTLTDSSKHDFGEKSSGPGVKGPYTAASGDLAYYEICLNHKNGWKTGWNKSKGSYIWNDKQFVSFDGIEDIKRKCCMIKELNLRGAMFWALDYDDFNNTCGYGAYPLLKTLNQQLRCLDGPKV